MIYKIEDYIITPLKEKENPKIFSAQQRLIISKGRRKDITCGYIETHVGIFGYYQEKTGTVITFYQNFIQHKFAIDEELSTKDLYKVVDDIINKYFWNLIEENHILNPTQI